MLKVVNLINGYMRTPKIEALHRLNSNYNTNIPLLAIDTTSFNNSSWLSGILDADGSFFYLKTK